MSDPGTSRAATSGKAAEDGSAGTTTGRGSSSGRPASVILRPCGPNGSLVISAPKWASIFSVWSREASLSMTMVRPGELRPARRIADLSWAEGTGVRYSIGAGSLVPLSVTGQRPPSASARTSAPISTSGSRMRRIGRLRRLASPSKVAVIAWPPTTPIISLVPVPALPKSSVARGASRLPMPAPATRQRPRPIRSTLAPSARQAMLGAQHVLAFEQPLDRRFADGEQSENQRPVRDRLVAGRPQAAAERAAAAGGQRRRAGVGGSVAFGCRRHLVLMRLASVAGS